MVKHCRVCLANRAGSSRPLLEPIIVHNVFERVQMDLIDMRLENDHIYEWILHIKDHFSKYSFLRPLTGKGTRQVARELEYWIQLMGPPRIIQCDNGREFKGAVLHILQRHGIKLIHSNPRHPQSQGLVEQGNSIVERKLRALMAQRATREWSLLLVEVIIAMNSEVHGTLRITPYEIVFNQRMRIDDWIPVEEREAEMLRLAQDEEFRMVEEIEEELENTSQIDERTTPPFLRTPTPAQIHDRWLFTSSSSSSSSPSDPQPSVSESQNIQPSKDNENPPMDIESSTDEATTQLENEYQDQIRLQNQRETTIAQVRQRSSQNRDRMIQKYNKRQASSPTKFVISDYVTVFIPRQDRAATDDRRLPARVIAIPHRDRYKLQTVTGILKHHYGTRHLEPVPSAIIPTIGDNPAVVTLRAAAKSVSRNPSGSGRARYNCKTTCSTNHCSCYKGQRKCTSNCHPRGTGDQNCCNLNGESESGNHESDMECSTG